jgi:hypothetical protein
MPNNFGFEHNDTFAIELLDKIKKLNFENCKNYAGAIDNSSYEFFLDFCPTHLDESIITKSIEIVTPTSYSFFVSEKGVSISTSNRYSFIYENYQNEWFNDFRNDILKIADLFNATEWFYMADNLSKISIFETDLMENLSYQQSKNNLLQTFGAPITDFKNLDYTKFNYDVTTDWFLDTSHKIG